MRQYTPFEEANLSYLNNQGVDYCTIEITGTGKGKSILDATRPIRDYFLRHHVHNYAEQGQGGDYKIMKPTVIITSSGVLQTKTSLYRPVTKKGDPRLWPYKIDKYTTPNDIYCLVAPEPNKLFFINITHLSIESAYNVALATPTRSTISSLFVKSSSVADELYALLLKKKDDWLDSPFAGDNAVGYAIEKAVNVVPNSSKSPDYKGVELKAHRKKRKSKKDVMFGKVPDRKLSKYDDNKLVEKFGYIPENCTHKTLQVDLNCLSANAQGLMLEVDENADLLKMIAIKNNTDGKGIKNTLAVWKIDELRKTLLQKHPETFWIEALSRTNQDGKEEFKVKQIIYTRNPIAEQFGPLLSKGIIIISIALARPGHDGKSGNGNYYNFRIKTKQRSLLFPVNKEYNF